MKIITLGPEYSYSDIITRLYINRNEFASVNIFYVTYAGDAIRRLSKLKNNTSIAIVPIKNSLTGVIAENQTLLNTHASNITILDTLELPISHVLCSKTPDYHTMPGRVKVYSHIQGLLQCSRYLEKHFPEARLVRTSSTAQAATMVAHLGDELPVLAVCSPQAAEAYGLHVISRSICDTGTRNVTTFYVLGPKNV